MTAYELIQELQKLPEDCEILCLLYRGKHRVSFVIRDDEPITEIEHCNDETPVAWIQMEG